MQYYKQFYNVVVTYTSQACKPVQTDRPTDTHTIYTDRHTYTHADTRVTMQHKAQTESMCTQQIVLNGIALFLGAVYTTKAEPAPISLNS